MANSETLTSKDDNQDWDLTVSDKTRVVFHLSNVEKGYLLPPPEIGNAGDNSISFVEEDSELLRGIPVDSGWAWMIVLASFGMHTLVVGAMKSFGVLFVEFRDKYNASARDLGTAQGIAMTLMLGLGLVANLLAVRFTSQKVVFAGGLLTALGFILSAYIPRFEFLYLTYSVITGLGFTLSYSPCVVMVGHHFKKRRSLANGISVSGAGVGSFLLPNLMRWMLNEYGLSGCLLLLGGLMLNVCGCAMLLRPISSYGQATQTLDQKFQQGKTLKQKDPDCQHLMESNKSDLVARIHDSNSYNIDNSYRQITAGHSLKTRSSLQSSGLPMFASNGEIPVTSVENIPQEDMKNIAAGVWTRMTCSCCRQKTESPEGRRRPRLFDWSLLSNPLFLIYALSCGLAYFAYPNIFFMLPAFAESNGQDRDSAALLLSIIGITDLAGRLFFGWFSDLSCLPRRFGFVAGLVISGLLNLVAPAMTSFAGMAVYAALYGFFAGSFFALISVMLVEALALMTSALSIDLSSPTGATLANQSALSLLCTPACPGVEKLSSSYGLATLAMSVGLLPGPLICGEIRDDTSKWDLAFILCGVVTLLASVPPLFEPCARKYVDGKVLGIQDSELLGIQDGELLGIQDGELLGIQDGELLGIQDGELLGIQDGELLGIQANTRPA